MEILTERDGRNASSDDHPNIWHYTYRIRSHEVAADDRLSMIMLFNLMQDGASSHAKALGLSVGRLLEKGYTWVLSRLILTLQAPLPRWEERVSIQTWPSGSKGPFALRNFLFKNSADQMVATAISGWLVIDAQTRKPQRIGPYSDLLRPITGRHILAPDLDKVPPPRQVDFQRAFGVRRGDLDINQHVNNVSYMEWLMETLPDDAVNSLRLKKIALNFMGEARQGDRVISEAGIAAAENKDSAPTYQHRIVREYDRFELFRAESEWEVI